MDLAEELNDGKAVRMEDCEAFKCEMVSMGKQAYEIVSKFRQRKWEKEWNKTEYLTHERKLDSQQSTYNHAWAQGGKREFLSHSAIFFGYIFLVYLRKHIFVEICLQISNPFFSFPQICSGINMTHVIKKISNNKGWKDRHNFLLLKMNVRLSDPFERSDLLIMLFLLTATTTRLASFWLFPPNNSLSTNFLFDF